MRTAARICFFFFFAGFNLSAQTQFESNLPIVFIDTQGNDIVDEPKISSKMGIVWHEDGSLNSKGEPRNHFTGNIAIEIRGSSSQMFPKKSFGFELRDDKGQDMDFPLLGMPEEEDWILYAPYSDKTLIRNVLTFTLGSSLGDYAPRCRFVELFINNEYQGVYVLMEKIKRDKHRVDIAKLKTDDISGEELSGGYIVKVDKFTGSNTGGWYSDYENANGGSTFYQFVYPKTDEIQPAQERYIIDYIGQFETALYNENFEKGSGYARFIDRESFFDFIIINELAKNVDGYRLSTFFYKDKNGKLNAGPLWDFNLGYGNANYYDGWETTGIQLYADIGDDYWQYPFWWQKMMHDSRFKNDLRCRWDSLRKNQLSEAQILAVTDSLVEMLVDPRLRNFEKWPIINQWVWPNYHVAENYWKEIYWLKNWVKERLSWLDFALPGECGSEKQEEVTESSFKVGPNPFSSEFRVFFNSVYEGNYVLRLYHSNGQKIKEIPLFVQLGINEFVINTSEIESGFYIYKLTLREHPITVGKIVKLS
jgi:hypothetical protein